MELRDTLLKENSRANVDLILSWIGGDATRFGQLMQLFLHDEYRVVQRAAHVIGTIADTQPDLLRPHLAVMVERMQEPGLPVAVKRNVVRVLQFLEIPEALHGPVMNTCFELLADPKESVAVRAFSMTVLANLAKHYPEIRQELKVLIEDGLEQDVSPGFKSRALKTLNRL